MSVSLRVRANKYHDLKPSEQKNTSGQRRWRRIEASFVDISEAILAHSPDDAVIYRLLATAGEEFVMSVDFGTA